MQNEVGSPRGKRPGWRHANGDPAGSVRYWNGARWDGEPKLRASSFTPRSVVQLSPFQYWLRVGQNWNEVDGRARRAEYWWFLIFNTVIQAAFSALMNVAFEEFVVLSFLFSLACVVPGITVSIRRMHDSNHSGWWIIVPIVNFIFSLIDGTRGPNKYGPSPKYFV